MMTSGKTKVLWRNMVEIVNIEYCIFCDIEYCDVANLTLNIVMIKH